MKLVHEFLEDSARRHPAKPALVCREERYTYAELNAAANGFAHGLLDAGLRRGDRVAILLDNRPEAVMAVFGTLKAGGVFSTLSPTVKAEKLAYILNHADARFLVSQELKRAVVDPAVREVSGLERVIMCEEQGGGAFVSWADFVRGRPGTDPGERLIDVDLANIVYTSGSTGDPKGIMMSHMNVSSAAHSITTYLENVDEDIVINVLPLSFDYGLYQALMCALVGMTLVLERGFVYPYAIIERIREEQVTGFPVVPTILAMLLRLKNLPEIELPSLRYVSNTGAALPEGHIRTFRRHFPEVRFYSMYGLSECKRVAYLPPAEIDRRPRSIGRAMPNCEAFVVDRNGDPVAPGVVGELVVRGANVMQGYWRSPEDTARVLRPGRFPGDRLLYTGDLFTSDEDGFLYYVARKDDLIKTRGERVSPREIENVLCGMPGISEAAVIGVPDEVLGAAIHAFVVLDGRIELTEEDVLSFSMTHLEQFMVPRQVRFREELPRNASGKVDKRRLSADEKD